MIDILALAREVLVPQATLELEAATLEDLEHVPV